jgi:hypothetical protein
MPAIKSEIEEAITEGIDIQFLSVPTQVLSSNGKMNAVECIRMELGDIDASGRRRPVPIAGSEFKVDVDTLILAISQEPDVSVLGGNGLKVSKWSTIEVDPENLHTNIEGVFAGGDVVTGPNTVTEAMAHGKIAAQMIDKYIRGKKLERKYEVTRPAVNVEAIELSEKEVQSLKKQEIASAPVAQRIKDFNEVELGFTEAQAISEAKRCLRCDLEEKEEEVVVEERIEEPVVEEKEVEKEEAAPEEAAVEEEVAKVEEAKEEVVEEKVEEVAEAKLEEPIAEKIEEKVEEKKEEAVEEKVEEVTEPKEEPKEKKAAAVIDIPDMKIEEKAEEKPEEKVEEKAEVTEEKRAEEKPKEKKVAAVIDIPDMKMGEAEPAEVKKEEEKKEPAEIEEKVEEKKEEEKAEVTEEAKPEEKKEQEAAEQKEKPKEKKIKAVIEIPEIKTEKKE